VVLHGKTIGVNVEDDDSYHVPSWEDAQEMGFQTLAYSNIPNTANIYVFILFTGV